MYTLYSISQFATCVNVRVLNRFFSNKQFLATEFKKSSNDSVTKISNCSPEDTTDFGRGLFYFKEFQRKIYIRGLE